MALKLRLFHDGVSSMRGKFDDKIKKHMEYQENCVFSDWKTSNKTRRFSKDQKEYGR